MSGVDVLAELDRRIAISRELCVVRDITDTPPGLADLIEARAAVAELIEKSAAALHYMRLHTYADQVWADDLAAALARCQPGEMPTELNIDTPAPVAPGGAA